MQSTATLRRTWKWIGALVVLLSAGLVFLRFSVHFGYVDEDKKQALEMIEQFHGRMNAGRFEEIYDDAHPAFRNALSKQEWLQHMLETREQYGLYRATRSSTLNVIMGTPVQVRVAYYSTFEKGDTTELFSFARDGRKPQLLIYGVYPGGTQVDSSSSSSKNR